MPEIILGILASYIVGSIPTAYCIGKWVRGIDIRKHGSGNVGATNAFRIIGKRWGIGILFLDALKGFVAAAYLPRILLNVDPPDFRISLLLGMTAIVGHTWTVWLRFRGGKGVATSAGAFLALAPGAAVAGVLLWMLVFAWKRYVSLASLITAITFPFWVLTFYWNQERFAVLFAVSLLLGVFICYTHRENIKRLREGTERRLI